MAAILTPDEELTYYSFPIEKSEETTEVNPVDGTPDLIVYGKATDGSVDSDLQIVDPDWSGKALQDWLATGGNLRVQHQGRRDPAGIGLKVDLTPDGHYVKALVAEPTAKHLVRIGALKDYSVGVSLPDIRPDPSGKAMNGVITGRQDGKTKISELSLVDRGSNFNSRFQLVKSAGDGSAEFVGKMLRETAIGDVEVTLATESEVIEKGVNLSIPDDVSVSFKPSDLAKLLKHREVAAKRNMDPNVGGGVDRDKLPASDFAGPDRSFPIVTPGDVSDAASSLGRTKHDPAQIRSRIISIAHRKGPSFVAQLPDSWTGGKDKVADVEVVIPETVKADGAKCDLCGGTGKIRDGKMDCPRCHADGKRSPGETDEHGEKAVDPVDVKIEEKPANNSAMKRCPGCGTANENGHGKCVNCGKQLGDAKPLEKDAEADVVKKDKVICKGCGANHDANHSFCPECGVKATKTDVPIQKNHDYTCLGCGKGLDPGEKFCPGCGRKNPGFNEMKKSVRAALDTILKGAGVTEDTELEPEVIKGAQSDSDDGNSGDGDDDIDPGDTDKPTGPNPADKPEGGAGGKMKVKPKKNKRGLAKGATPTTGVSETRQAKPAPAHREPDGAAVESFERDSGMPTDPDRDPGVGVGAPGQKTADVEENPEVGASMRLKGLGVPADLGQLHDATCPCYHPADVSKAYPYFSLADVDVDYWQAKAFETIATAPLEEAAAAKMMWQHATTLKGALPEDILGIQLEFHKAFADANPGPGSAPTPSAISPQRFKRPYLTGGHAAPSPGQKGPNTATVPDSDIAAAMYHRDYLSAGHAAESPANKGISMAGVTGAPTRTFYTNTGRDQARQAMSVMHDHIASTFPGLCPAEGTSLSARPPSTPPSPSQVPTPTGTPSPKAAPVGKGIDDERLIRKARKRLERRVLAGTITLDDARAELVKLTASEPEEAKAVEADVTKAAILDQDAIVAIVTKAVGDAVASRDEELAELRKMIKKQAKTIDSLAAEPAPGGPFRGPAMLASPPTPAMVSPVPGRVERTQDVLAKALWDQWRNDPNPTQREVAWAELTKLHGIDTSTTLQ